MKKLLFVFAILALAVPAMAWQINWSAVTGANGYEVSYKPLTASVWAQVDNGTATTWTIPTTLVKGTRYEFFVKAYVGTTTKSYSGDSDHIRWTYPLDPIVIELPATPVSITITQP